MLTVDLANETTQEALLILSDLFKAPDDDMLHALSNGELEKELNGIFKRSGLRKRIVFHHKPEDLHEWKYLHFRCFSGFEKPFAAPVESIYKPWTNDPDASVPFARDKGLIMGDSAMHIRYLLQTFQMEIPEEFDHTPDHLAILLEMCAFFLEHGDHAFTVQFIDDHFDWLNDFLADLRKVQNSSFYIEAVMAVKHVLSLTRKLLIQ